MVAANIASPSGSEPAVVGRAAESHVDHTPAQRVQQLPLRNHLGPAEKFYLHDAFTRLIDGSRHTQKMLGEILPRIPAADESQRDFVCRCRA